MDSNKKELLLHVTWATAIAVVLMFFAMTSCIEKAGIQ